jgi:folate-binding protein YgfZ
MPDARYCRQPGLGLLRIAGRDARKFLHAQTTQRIDDLPTQATRLAAWLSAKGRVLGLFDVVPEGDSFLLLLPADNAAAVRTGLGRYVLRDDVRIEPETGRAVWTLVGEIDPWLRAQGIALAPGAVIAAGDATRAQAGGATLAGTGDATLAQTGDATLARTGEQRVDLISVSDARPALLTGLAETDPDAAAQIAIAAGRPELPLALADRYTPHMLNLEQLDAVSFTKGCYPGQEIVARTEHRGEVKRRIRRFACAAGPRPLPGDAIVDGTGTAAGEVNRAAQVQGGFELLAVVALDKDPATLRLVSNARALEPLP